MNDPSVLLNVSILLLCAFLFLALSSRNVVYELLIKKTPDPTSGRTPVPWGLEIAFALIIFFGILAPLVCGRLCRGVSQRVFPAISQQASGNADLTAGNLDSGTQGDNEEEKERQIEIAKQHPLARLLMRSDAQRFYPILVLFIFSAVLIAPLTEEFVFRVVLQGAFERRLYGEEAASKFKVALSIVAPAFVFALLHIGTTGNISTNDDPLVLTDGAIATIVADLATLLCGLLFLRRFFAPTLSELGLPSRDVERRRPLVEVARDVYRGAIVFFWLAPILYPLNMLMGRFAPPLLAAPIAIFAFALCEGWVYYRTRRWGIVAGMHIALNFVSLIFVCIWIAKSMIK